MRVIDQAHAIVAPVDTVDHVLGDPLGPVIVEYGDYECPYARVAFREIERVQLRTENAVRFVFRHFPLTELHPHALAAAAAAEAAARSMTGAGSWGSRGAKSVVQAVASTAAAAAQPGL